MATSEASEYAIGQMVDRLTRAAEMLLDGDLRPARAWLSEAGGWLEQAITSGTGVPGLLEGDDATASRLGALVRTLDARIERQASE